MSNKYDEPPAYSQAQQQPGGPPMPPQPAYHGNPYSQGPPGGPYGAPPGGYYQPGPQMGYGPQPGYGPGGYPPQGGYYPPQGGYYHQEQDRRGPGFMEALLASLACCCCLDCLLF
ncbi:hypothetical protein QBC46DRAFT_31415 [Diplogelasinospora grovesii]|uniref:Cysteine-rich transmembrane CYSTM domain-containing protein n=1 Tax=Diplogelasinospora grovesii TaxID=303347 RepID=A0AAN6MZH9_9PEZI|nr:hypothetical protein QBC46DRAFT_31415 [Diplogelasinospora grovesii]